MTRILLFILFVAALAIAGCATETNNDDSPPITNFEECVTAGNPIMESYPRQCSDGEQTFVENITTQTFEVAPQKQDCVGIGPQECLVVNGSFFYDNIEGFDYEEGYTYTIQVIVTERENPPADANSKKYSLFRVIEKERIQQACTREYRPVCGEVQVQCITTPCNPIQTTFSNACEAENAGAEILYDGACVEEETNLEGACLSFDGNWLEESNECEGMPQEMCEDLGGTYNECASACRNDPDAMICTAQCVMVCQFP